MEGDIYANKEIFSHLGKGSKTRLPKGQNIDMDMEIYANTDAKELNGAPSCHVDPSAQTGAESSSAPHRWPQVLLAVLCLILLCGLVALGVLYVEKRNKSDSLEAQNRNLSVFLFSVEQKLAGTERNLEELLVKHRNLLKNFSDSASKVCTECANGKNYQGKCYFSSTEKMTWIQSRDYCKSKGAHLVIIHNKKEQDFVHSTIEETRWIGLSDRETERTWRWVDNTLLSQTNTTFWWQNEPDNWIGGGDPNGEDCASMGDHNGNLNYWFDASCEKKKKCVCEVELFRSDFDL
ncbi:hypothetical protein MATL_G00230950 [Megalops atlanticus]|uniref:C-type lectin domain-containing protein n=1 Tax=Megalops atlanticus TaxID=7932 RepID=A0A9D3PF68_MEGAT|nr:hypothetical protein MATL_G00230950 [Megalops atlanticus]